MITPLLAVGETVSVSSVQIGEFLVVLLAVLAGYTRLRKFEDRIAGKGDRTEITNKTLEVREAASFATKPELIAVETRINGEVHQLHGRISAVRNELTVRMEALESRIDAVPERTIELLKTIKEYHQK